MLPKGLAYVATLYAFGAALIIVGFLVDPYRLMLGKYIPECGPIWVRTCMKVVEP